MRGNMTVATTRAIEQKAERLRQGKHPRVLDLFSGCGGITLGFHGLGCEIAGAVEIDENAARSHAINFFRAHSPSSVFELHARPRDIAETAPEELMAELGAGAAETAVDIVVGGPPCQAYARVGRAKLRDVAAHPEAFKVDPRANLYLRYLFFVSRLKPLALLMENVPDIMNFGGHNIAQEVAETLEGMGYVARYSLVNAAFYGVPQMRDRVVLLAVRRELGVTPTFPAPERFMELPRGYAGTRAVAYKHIDMFTQGAFVEAMVDRHRPSPVTAYEALCDLPPIRLHLENKLKRGIRRFHEVIPYDAAARPSEYGLLMRKWKGFENDEGLRDHVIRFLPRDSNIFRNMAEGAEYPEAHRIAVRLYEKAVEKLERRGKRLSRADKDALRRQMVPPYPIETFPNRWWKLRRDFPSRTLMAHIGKDTYSHIHYDSSQARVISVREAARLQSFPDGFVFAGAMNSAFRQIGNAVPPLLAKAIGAELLKTLASALRGQASAAA